MRYTGQTWTEIKSVRYSVRQYQISSKSVKQFLIWDVRQKYGQTEVTSFLRIHLTNFGLRTHKLSQSNILMPRAFFEQATPNISGLQRLTVYPYMYETMSFRMHVMYVWMCCLTKREGYILSSTVSVWKLIFGLNSVSPFLPESESTVSQSRDKIKRFLHDSCEFFSYSHQQIHDYCKDYATLDKTWDGVRNYLLTYLLTYLPTYLLTHSLTHSLTQSMV
jgi:hypothetical protein